MTGAVVQRAGEHASPEKRTLEERLMLRAPAASRAVGRLVFGLRPTSRLRQAALRHQVRSGWAAASRRDFDLVLVRYRPDVVYEFDPSMVMLGLPPRAEGHAAMMQAVADWAGAWAHWRFALDAIVDLDDRLVNLGRLHASGSASTADLQTEYAQVLDLDGGAVGRERDFMSWSGALEAAGLAGQLAERVRGLAPGSTTVLEVPATGTATPAGAPG